MKKFFFQVLSSFMGAWIAIVLSGVVAVLLVIGLVGSMMKGESQTVGSDTVLRIDLSGNLIEREDLSNLSLMQLLQNNREQVQTVETLKAALSQAASNDNVKCVYLDCGGISAAPATLNALRHALMEFRKQAPKKKIFAYADALTEGDYFVASTAHEIALNPAGMMEMRGLGGQSLYYKDFFDKIGVQFQAVRVGKGKAAVEPYTMSEMSDVARSQSLQLMTDLWADFRKEISESRKGITPAMIDTLVSVDMISCKPAQFVLAKNLVDTLSYRHSFEEKIALYAGQSDGLENECTPKQLASMESNPLMSTTANNQVAVLYATGGIDGFGDSGIVSADLVEQILNLADDDNVKALVLRVNSPGGSAFGSEQIWEALEQFKKSGKPFVVSMGDYAASGGYYISCGAQRIFADRFTITGSIGIFGLIPNINGLLKKLGVNPQLVATNPQAVFPNLFHPLDERQLAAMQSMVTEGYNLFVKRCADGRKTTVSKIEEIADGRPLSASAALKCGLIDEIGYLDNAVEYAAKVAKLKDYNVVAYPNQGSMFDAIMKGIDKGNMALSLFESSDAKVGLNAARILLKNYQGNGCVRASLPCYQFEY